MQVDELKKQLNERVCTVIFTKVNGETRVMECTTNLDLMPPSAFPASKSPADGIRPSTQIRVYDLNAQSWRSFLFENLVSVA